MHIIPFVNGINKEKCQDSLTENIKFQKQNT